MRIIVGNVECKIVYGGADHLLDIDVEKTLREYLRVRPENYSRSMAYRKHRWDGYRYFVTKDLRFATGFLPMVSSYLMSLGFDLDVEDQRTNLPILKEDFDETIGEWTLRDYQKDMVLTIDHYIDVGGKKLYFPRGIWDAATNAGKTSAIAGLYNNVENPVALFLLSKQDAFKQMVDYFSTMYSVGQVRSGYAKFTDFTVAMAKTLLNRIEKKDMSVLTALAKVNVLFVDETHEAGASDYSKLLQRIPAGMRVFVSGTPLDNADPVNNLITIGLSGSILYRITNKELIAKGVSLNPKINILLNPLEGKDMHDNYVDAYEDLVKFSEGRMKLIGDLVEKHSDKQILITFKEKDQGKFIYEQLVKRFPYLQNESAYIHGESPNRYSAVEAFKKNKMQVLIASMILKQSINIPNIEVLIMAHGGKSKITLKQFIGRAIRDDGKNSEVIVYDFYDEGKYVSSHSKTRLAQYRSEEFDIEYHYDATPLGTPKRKKLKK